MNMKRLFALLLAVCLVVGAFPMSAFGTEGGATDPVPTETRATEPTPTETTATEPETTEPETTEPETTEPEVTTPVCTLDENCTLTEGHKDTCPKGVAIISDDLGAPVVAKIGDVEYTDLKTAFQYLAANGGTVELTAGATIALTGEWGEVNFNKEVTVNGNGATITGLTHPLIMNANGTVAIKNLTIQNSNIVGINTSQCNWATESTTAGAFFGFTSGSISLENCHLKDSTVTATEYAGGLVGYDAKTLVISGCSVYSTTINGGSSTGAMLGHTNGKVTITGSVGGNTINSNGGSGWQGTVCGVVTGATGNTINVTETAQSTSNSDLYVVGGRLVDVNFTGGSYYSNPADRGDNEYATEGNGNAIPTDGYQFAADSNGTYALEKLPVIATIGETEYTDLKKAFAELATNGGTVELAKDATIPVKDWEALTLGNVTINGNGATITGLTAPFIGSASDAVIKDLKLEEPVTSNILGGGLSVSGALIGYVSRSVTVENCVVSGGNITSSDYTGGLIGYSGASSLNIINCSVTETTVTGKTVGGIIGLANGNVSISGTVGSNTLNGEKAAKEGSVIGNLLANDNNYVNVTEKSKSSGSFANPLPIIGRLYKRVTYIGGTYYANPDARGEGDGEVSTADGYTAVDNGNGTYSVKRADINATYGGAVTFAANISGAGTVTFYCGETKLGEGTIKDGAATLEYNTTLGGIPAGNGNIITAKCTDGASLLKNDGKFTVNLAPATLTLTKVETEAKTYDGTTEVVVKSCAFDGLQGSDTVMADVEANTADANVGTAKAVTISEITLTGDKKDYYTVVIPEALKVTADITPAVLTATYAGETIVTGREPKLEVTVTGFVGGETAATAHGYEAPKLTNTNTTVGTYKLTPAGGKATNYIFTYVGGDLKIEKAVDYSITQGDKQEVENGAAATFTSNADFSKFVEVRVDGKVVAPENYTAVSGSTKVTLKDSFIKTLAPGEHTITILSLDGEAAAKFTVKAPETQPTEPEVETNHKFTILKSDEKHHWYVCENEGCAVTSEKKEHEFGSWKVVEKPTEKKNGSDERVCKVCDYKETRVTKYATNADTSDSILPLVGMMGASGLALAAALILGRKRRISR